MLQVFYLDVAYVCNIFRVFLQVFQTHVFKCFICLFCMLQVLHPNVSKVNHVAHVMRVGSERDASGLCVGARRRRCQGGAGPHVGARNAVARGRCPCGASPHVDARNGAKTDRSPGRLSGRPGASSADLRRIPDRIREEEVAPAGKLPGVEKGNIVLLSGS